MNMSYAFTEDDLWAYLATKRDDEVVGYCGGVSTCLIAQAVQAKYANRIGSGGVHVGVSSHGSEVEIALLGVGVHIPLMPRLETVMLVFDDWTGKVEGQPITKAEFLWAWQAFLAEQEEHSDFLSDRGC
jgi:hypothetical protein